VKVNLRETVPKFLGGGKGTYAKQRVFYKRRRRQKTDVQVKPSAVQGHQTTKGTVERVSLDIEEGESGAKQTQVRAIGLSGKVQRKHRGGTGE